MSEKQLTDKELVDNLDSWLRGIPPGYDTEHLMRLASRRITELSRVVAEHYASQVMIVSAQIMVEHRPESWRVLMRYWTVHVAQARYLVDMGLWEENPTPTNHDTIEVRPVKRVTPPGEGA